MANSVHRGTFKSGISRIITIIRAACRGMDSRRLWQLAAALTVAQMAAPAAANYAASEPGPEAAMSAPAPEMLDPVKPLDPPPKIHNVKVKVTAGVPSLTVKAQVVAVDGSVR